MAGQTRRFFHFKRNMSAFEEKNAVLASYCLFSSLLFPSFRRIITKNRARQPIASSPRLLFSFPDGPLSSPLSLSLSQLLSFFLLLLLHRKQVTLRIRFNSIVWKRQSEDICIRYLANVAKSLPRFRTNFRRKFARSKWKIRSFWITNKRIIYGKGSGKEGIRSQIGWDLFSTSLPSYRWTKIHAMALLSEQTFLK